MLSIEFTTDLGAKVTVSFERAEQVLDVQRQYGKLGWVSGDLPSGGFQFPFENEHDFDWALIGARPFTNDEGEACVWCRGAVWKRRELEAVQTKKITLPAAVKYSRGAKPTDPPHIREKADGDIEYVTLAMFRGGKRQERYAVPSPKPTPKPPTKRLPDYRAELARFKSTPEYGVVRASLLKMSEAERLAVREKAMLGLRAIGLDLAQLAEEKISDVVFLGHAMGVM